MRAHDGHRQPPTKAERDKAHHGTIVARSRTVGKHQPQTLRATHDTHHTTLRSRRPTYLRVCPNGFRAAGLAHERGELDDRGYAALADDRWAASRLVGAALARPACSTHWLAAAEIAFLPSNNDMAAEIAFLPSDNDTVGVPIHHVQGTGNSGSGRGRNEAGDRGFTPGFTPPRADELGAGTR